MTFALRATRGVGAFAFLALLSEGAAAKEFYVDPANGAATGDGSAGNPWQTLENVVSAGHIGKDVHAGDTIWLKAGYHGALTAKGGTYSPAITIAAANGEKAHLSRASFSQTHGWVLSDVSISPSYAPSPPAGTTMVQVDKASSDVVVKGCELFSVPDASSWTADQWINVASSAFQISGDHVTVSHNNARNVRFGISVDGPNALIEYNQVVNFSADGMRGLGNDGVFQYNVVKNVYVDQDTGDDNHDDGFQSWSVGPNGPGDGVVTGVVLRGNVILNREDPNQKLTNSLQGIGCFDGFFDGWVVENNVVITDHWHGISFYGMKNSRIVNNTVIDVNDVSPGPPWIMVTAHKNGTVSENVLVRNNLATDYDVSGNSIVQDHNTTLKDLALVFVNPAKFDLHLLPGGPAVDTGSSDQAPALDADRIPRPQGKAVDLGAYELHDSSVAPADGGAGGASPGAGGTTSGAGGTSGGGTSGGGTSTGGKSTGGRTSAGAGGSTGGRATSSSGGASSGGAPSGSAGEPGNGGDTSSGGSVVSGADAGSGTAESTESSGCGCRVGGRANTGALAILAVAVSLLARRRRAR
jgi:hypothetical protein